MSTRTNYRTEKTTRTVTEYIWVCDRCKKETPGTGYSPDSETGWWTCTGDTQEESEAELLLCPDCSKALLTFVSGVSP